MTLHRTHAGQPSGELLSLTLEEIRSHPDFVRAVADIQGMGVLTKGYQPQPTASSPEASFDTQRAAQAMSPEQGMLRACSVSTVEHMQQALQLPHPLAGFTAAEPPDLVNAAKHVASFIEAPQDLLNQRQHNRDTLDRIADLLRPLTTRLTSLMSPSVRSVAGKVHLALLDALLHAIEWPDTSLISDFVMGFPIVGTCPPSSVPAFKKVSNTPATDISSLDHRGHNAKVARSILAHKDDDGQSAKASALWAATIDEKQKGQCQGPYFSSTDLDRKFDGAGSWRCMERFGVVQEKSDGSAKIRGCDNAASSRHNECTHLSETITCEKADFPLRMAALFADHLGTEAEWSMALGTDDIEAAYRRLPCATPQYSVVALLDPQSGRVAYFVVPGLCFGLTASVNQFNRFPEAMTAIARRLLGLVASHYVDDYATCEPTFTRCSAQTSLRLLHALVGIPLAPSKHVPMGSLTVFLGAVTDFTKFHTLREVTLRPKPGRVDKICRIIEAILLPETKISSALLSSLRGKLQFIFSVAFYRIGKPALYAISRFQRSYSHPTRAPGYLRNALEFVRAVLPSIPPRTVSMLRRNEALRAPPVIIWTDAMWTPSALHPAQVGYVAWIPSNSTSGLGSFHYGSRILVPAELDQLEERGNQILPLELLAAACVYESIPSLITGTEVIHFIDNSTALSNAIKGSAKKDDCARIVCSMHLAIARAKITPWFAYVASKANIADLPSRGEKSGLLADLESAVPSSRAEEHPTLFPVAKSWAEAALDPLSYLPSPPPRPKRRGGVRRKRGAVA